MNYYPSISDNEDDTIISIATTRPSNNNKQKQEAGRYFFCLGTCAWALVNAIFAELPILIRDWCDNDWSIISLIALCISLSNLAPLLWTIVLDVVSVDVDCAVVGIGTLLVFGIATSFFFILLSNQHDGFILFSGKTWILLLSSCSGLVGTMSLVLFYPHAAKFSSSDAIPSLANGTAMANFFLAILAMLQHPSLDQPSFPLSTYFGIVSALFLCSTGGYLGTVGLLRKQTTATSLAKQREELNVLLPRDNSLIVATAALSESTTSSVDGNSTPLRLSVVWNPCFRIPYLVQFLWNGLIFFLPGVVPYAVKNVVDNNHDNVSSLLALSYLTISQLLSHTIGTALTGIIPYNNKDSNNKDEDYRLAIGFALALVLLWIPLVFQFCVFHPTMNFLISMLPITLNAILCGWYSYASTRCFQIVAMRCTTDPATTDHHQQKQEYVSRLMGVLHQLGAMLGSILGFWMVTKLKQ